MTDADKDLFTNATTFEREAREAPEEYYQGQISAAEADRELAELAHLSEVAREMMRGDKPS